MARPAKMYARRFCAGLELPLSYRIPEEGRRWLDGYLAVSGDDYHNAKANPVDVLIVWRWVSWDVATIQRRRAVSRRHASDLYEYAVAFDRWLCRYMESLSEQHALMELDAAEWCEWMPCQNGLNLNRLAELNAMYRGNEENSECFPIDKRKLKKLLARLFDGE